MKRGQSGLNGIIAIDKPKGMSSHDVVNVVRRSIQEKRVGHAGTLDPEASGVLVIGIGLGTRLMAYLTADTKAYVASITFGEQTNTDDAEGEVIRRAQVPSSCFDEDFASQTIAALKGIHMQVPPSFSAISVGGKRSYTRARAGESFELPAREVEILDSDFVRMASCDPLVWEARFRVSKGTYIRSIARDLGFEVNSAAHLCALRRIESGSIGLNSCISLDELKAGGIAYAREHLLDPVEHLGLALRYVSESDMAHVIAGRSLSMGKSTVDDGELCVLVRDGRIYGIWRRCGRSLRPQASFLAGIEGVSA